MQIQEGKPTTTSRVSLFFLLAVPVALTLFATTQILLDILVLNTGLREYDGWGVLGMFLPPFPGIIILFILLLVVTHEAVNSRTPILKTVIIAACFLCTGGVLALMGTKETLQATYPLKYWFSSPDSVEECQEKYHGSTNAEADIIKCMQSLPTVFFSPESVGYIDEQGTLVDSELDLNESGVLIWKENVRQFYLTVGVYNVNRDLSVRISDTRTFNENVATRIFDVRKQVTDEFLRLTDAHLTGTSGRSSKADIRGFVDVKESHHFFTLVLNRFEGLERGTYCIPLQVATFETRNARTLMNGCLDIEVE